MKKLILVVLFLILSQGALADPVGCFLSDFIQDGGPATGVMDPSGKVVGSVKQSPMQFSCKFEDFKKAVALYKQARSNGTCPAVNAMTCNIQKLNNGDNSVIPSYSIYFYNADRSFQGDVSTCAGNPKEFKEALDTLEEAGMCAPHPRRCSVQTISVGGPTEYEVWVTPDSSYGIHLFKYQAEKQLEKAVEAGLCTRQ